MPRRQHEMIACVDVDYREEEAVAACVAFSSWEAPAPESEWVRRIREVAPYEPGQFYRRELPCVLAVLELADVPLRTLVVDGYVWLDSRNRPGLGAHLYEALGKASGVVGVAKRPFFRGPNVRPVSRGRSSRPLFVTSAGVDLEEAVSGILRMHGDFRIPTLLKRVDELARSG